MKLVVSHLTRMQEGYMCVAGVDLQGGRHVRPVLRRGGPRTGLFDQLVDLLLARRDGRATGMRLSTKLLARHGGPFDIGAVVDLGATRPVPNEPEVEDVVFDPTRARVERAVDADEFWSLLRQQAVPTLAAIFGDDLTRRGSSAIVELGRGKASLGCLAPRLPPRLVLLTRAGRPDRLRLRMREELGELDLSVSDIRFYGDDHVTPEPAVVQRINRQLEGGDQVILAVGLTRPFSSEPGAPPLHWLQVNNLHLRSDPLWRLG